MEYRWSEVKDRELQATRGISFRSIEAEIRGGGIVDIIAHPKRPNQRVILLHDSRASGPFRICGGMI